MSERIELKRVIQSSLGANPFLLIRLASLSSIMLVSTLRGCLRAQSMQVVTPGRASSLNSEIGSPQSWQSLRGVPWVASLIQYIRANEGPGSVPLVRQPLYFCRNREISQLV